MRSSLMVGLLAIMLAAIGSAQNFRGGISGIVTDQSGAIVPDATVKATNAATGLVYSTTGSTAGEFFFCRFAAGLLHSGRLPARIFRSYDQRCPCSGGLRL